MVRDCPRRRTPSSRRAHPTRVRASASRSSSAIVRLHDGNLTVSPRPGNRDHCEPSSCRVTRRCWSSTTSRPSSACSTPPCAHAATTCTPPPTGERVSSSHRPRTRRHDRRSRAPRPRRHRGMPSAARWTANPIIVLTVDDGENRKVEALDAGADDYVTKPFSMPELLARVRVALRHQQASGRSSTPRDPRRSTAHRRRRARGRLRRRPLRLTPQEFDAARAARPQPRPGAHPPNADRRRVGPSAPDRIGQLRIHVNQLRRKLATDDEPRCRSSPNRASATASSARRTTSTTSRPRRRDQQHRERGEERRDPDPHADTA